MENKERPRLLHIADSVPTDRIWSDVFKQALGEIGELDIIENGRDLSDVQRAQVIRGYDILFTGWATSPVPEELAANPGRLKYICHITGEMRRAIPIQLIEAGIAVTNWGDYPANGVAEGAMALLLATMKDLHEQIMSIRNDAWQLDMSFHGGSLEGLDVGVYGFGAIGRRFVELLRPFGSTIRIFDPYAPSIPEDCIRVDSLHDLFSNSQAIVIHAGLTPDTRKTVTRELLSLLPRHGIVVNTARGGIVDQEALFAELETGRLRAGLDVLEPDGLEPGHPARTWPNLILTAHRAEATWPDDALPQTKLNKMQNICIDNVQRFLDGQSLRYAMDVVRYNRST